MAVSFARARVVVDGPLASLMMLFRSTLLDQHDLLQCHDGCVRRSSRLVALAVPGLSQNTVCAHYRTALHGLSSMSRYTVLCNTHG